MQTCYEWRWNYSLQLKNTNISLGKRVTEEVGLKFCYEGAEAGRLSDDGWERIEKSWAEKWERSRTAWYQTGARDREGGGAGGP